MKMNIDFKASAIVLPEDLHCVINTPLEKYGGPLYINTADGVFTMKNGDVNQKTVIFKHGHTIAMDAFWYDECVYYMNYDGGSA